MPVFIKIADSAFDPAQPLAGLNLRSQPLYARPLTPPAVPSFNNPEGSTGAPGPGFIASASPQTFRSNINEDGTFPTQPALETDERQDVVVHISPTSGSTIIRGNNWNANNAELDPAYGLDVTVNGVELQEDVFETAVNEPVGAQFKANLQDLLTRGIIEVFDENGVTMEAHDIAAYTAP